MLPKFPEFKKLELSDQAEIEIITSQFPPYSDFNFESMWSWNVHGKYRISSINGNLIVIFADHFTDEIFLSLIGTQKINESLSTILGSPMGELGRATAIYLVPEEMLAGLDFSKFIVEIDLNNYDYVYDTAHLARYDGSEFAGKRKLVARFLRRHEQCRVENLNLKDLAVQKQILDLSEQWAHNKVTQDEGLNLEKEMEAIRKFLASDFENEMAIGIIEGDKLVGYQICSLITQYKYAICHFGKTDVAYMGSFEYLMNQGALALEKEGIHYINTEEDLGLLPLRAAKNSYKPVKFLKKYTIRKS